MGGAQSSAQGQGYHVLRVQENSPAHAAGIEPFFDYVVGINGLPLNTPESRILQDQLLTNVDKEVILTIYSTKEQELRNVPMSPNKNWTTNPNDGLIGLSIRFCTYASVNEHVWHILDVSPNSPAELAGLAPYTDFIIGTPYMTLHDENDFYELVEQNLGRPLRLYVYNSNFDVCREIVIVPNHDWGGDGALGCGVGYGYLHRIPKTNKFKNHSQAFPEIIWNEKQLYDEKVPAENYGVPIKNDAPSIPQSPPLIAETPAAPLIIETPAPPLIIETPAEVTEQEIKENSTVDFVNSDES